MTLLLEVGFEEMPPSHLKALKDQVLKKLPGLMDKYGLQYDRATTKMTPRRFALRVDGIPAQQAQTEKLIKGPPRSACYYQDGTVAPALEKFIKSNQVSEEDIRIVEENGKSYVYAVKREGGKSSIEIMPALIVDLLSGLWFPKIMTWGQGYSFGRPIRWLVTLLDERLLDVEFCGVKSDRISKGLRVFGHDVSIASPDEYESALRSAMVLVDEEERRAAILRQAEYLASKVGGKPHLPEKLLEELVYINEYPTGFIGHFSQEFLRLPSFVLETVMVHHQRYVAITDEEGKLLPYFVGFRNGPEENISQVVIGNERVIRARFYDALFFVEEDLKRPFADRIPELARISFLGNYGTLLDKAQRVKKLLSVLGKDNDPDLTALAELYNADLTTMMVQELPELHGLMGAYYAGKTGVKPQIAEAIAEVATDPSNQLSATIKLLDALDTMFAGFDTGFVPSGSSDPLGLKGLSFDVLTIAEKFFPEYSVEQLVTRSAHVLDKREIGDKILAFFEDRLESWITAGEVRVRNAVLDRGLSKPIGALRRLVQFLDRYWTGHNVQTVALAHRRTRNIIRNQQGASFDPALGSPNDLRLYEATLNVDIKIDPTRLKSDNDLMNVLECLVVLSEEIHHYFDKELVMAEDEKVRRNRIALLRHVDDMMSRIAYFGELVI
ncbi:glycine--tRNA ligase subunit beta [Coprothermobacteraceae bacterium]|nr:glycine--tRNA ligase subunit beta [Coprothermobacteraceae bacterium]